MSDVKDIKVFCPAGCNSARTIAALIREVAAARQVAVTLEEIVEPERIAACGVVRPPAVMVDGALVLAGEVPDWIAVEQWLTQLPCMMESPGG